MAMHGFTIKVAGADGKPETVLFASCRKHPMLLGVLKEINKLIRRQEQLSLKRQVMRNRLAALVNPDTSGAGAADPYASKDAYESLAAATEAMQNECFEVDQNMDDLNEAVQNATYDFLLNGLLGAGYTQELAEGHVIKLDPEKFFEIRERSMIGCGALDFTKRDSD